MEQPNFPLKAIFFGLVCNTLFITPPSFAALPCNKVANDKNLFRTTLKSRVVTFVIIYYADLYRQIMIGKGEQLDALIDILGFKMSSNLLIKLRSIAQNEPTPYKFAMKVIRIN